MKILRCTHDSVRVFVSLCVCEVLSKLEEKECAHATFTYVCRLYVAVCGIGFLALAIMLVAYFSTFLFFVSFLLLPLLSHNSLHSHLFTPYSHTLFFFCPPSQI